jgi:hypothetical protein
MPSPAVQHRAAKPAFAHEKQAVSGGERGLAHFQCATMATYIIV